MCALVGVLLMIIGVAGYVLTHMVSRTALIPAAIGAVLLLTTLRKRESARHARHPVRNAVKVVLLNDADELLLMCMDDPTIRSLGAKYGGPSGL